MDEQQEARSAAQARPALLARHATALGGALLAATLAACGGGGADGPVAAQIATPTPPSPDGCNPPIAVVAGGSLPDGAGGSFILVAPAVDGTRMLFYGPDLQRTGRVTRYTRDIWPMASPADCPSQRVNGKLSNWSPSGESVYLEVAPQGTAPDITGSIRDGGTTTSFTGGRIPGSNYAFDAPPRVADAVGAWTLNPLKGAPFRIEIAADGSLTGDATIELAYTPPVPIGCRLSGRVSADSQAKVNLLSLTLQAACNDPYTGRPWLPLNYLGFVLSVPLQSGGTQLLLWARWVPENAGVGGDPLPLFGIGRR